MLCPMFVVLDVHGLPVTVINNRCTISGKKTQVFARCAEPSEAWFAGSGIPMQRGASLTTSEHIDPASPPAQLADMEDPDNADIPEGAVRFNVTAEDIAAAIAEESLEVPPAVRLYPLVAHTSDILYIQ